MKTDLSRWSFDPARPYSGVYQQQGRLISDADWNELMEIVKHQVRDALKDVVGSGTPRPVLQGQGASTLLAPQAVVYVDGLRGLLNPGSSPLALQAQPQYPLPAATVVPADAGFYVDVWERVVTAAEDPGLRDSALGGADTCSRTQTLAQLKWFRNDPFGFGAANFSGFTRQPTGSARLVARARALPTSATAVLADRLLRIEVHDVDYNLPGGGQRLTLKWSDDNAAQHFAVDDLPPDDFCHADAVFEFYTAASDSHLGINLAPDLRPLRGQLRPAYLPVPRDAEALACLCPDPQRPGPLLVRRWDGYCDLQASAASGGRWTLACDATRPVDAHNHAGKMGSAWLPGERGAGADTDTGAWIESGAAPDTQQFVIQTADLRLELALTLSPQGEIPCICGDYWLVQVRGESETPVQVLNGGAVVGVVHHYLRLPGSAAGKPQFDFASLTRIEDRLVHKTGDRMSGALAIDSGKHDDAEVLLDAQGTLAARGLKLQTGSSPPGDQAVLSYEAATGHARWRDSTLSAWTLNQGSLATNPAVVTGTVQIGPALYLAAGSGNVGIGSPNTLSSRLYVDGALTVAPQGLLAANGGINTSTLLTSGQVAVGGALSVTGTSVLTGTLTAHGGVNTSTLATKSDGSVGGALRVTGASTLTGPLTAPGGVNTSGLSVSGNARVDGTVTASDLKTTACFSIGANNLGYITVASAASSATLLLGGHGVMGLARFKNFSTGQLLAVEAKNLSVASDARLKSDIQPLPDALDRLSRLRGVGFQWKDDASALPHLGFIAQEVLGVVPEVVHQGQDGHYVMDYNGLLPLVVEALKAQQAEIADLRARLAALGPGRA